MPTHCRQLPSVKRPIRFLLHIPRGTIKVVLYLVFFGTLVFFGLTRTTAGREGVRTEIENRFRSNFAGSIQIGRLSGNLVYTFIAENVSLFDPDGTLIAHIDTVRAEPRWESLVSRQLRLNSIELRGVLVDLERDEQDTWNIAEAVRPLAPADSATSPFSLIAPDVRISRASVRIRNRGSVPELVRNGTLYDYLNETINVERTRFVVDWDGATKQVDVINFVGHIAARNVSVRRFQSQIVLENQVVSFNEFSLTTAGSRIELTGNYDTDRTGLAPGQIPRAFDADIRATPLASSELTNFVPGIVARDALLIEARVSGDNNAIVISNASVARGPSAIQAAGVVEVGSDSLHFDLGLSTPGLRRADLEAVFPNATISRWTAVDSVRGEVWVQARTARSDPASMVAEIQADLESRAGSISATGRVSMNGRRIRNYAWTSAIADVNLATVTAGRLPESLLTGNIDASASGSDVKTIVGTLTTSLRASTFAGISVDTLNSRIVANRGEYSLTSYYRQATGSAQTVASYDVTDTVPRFSAVINGSDLNFAIRRGPNNVSTQFNGRLELRGSGDGLKDFQGTVRVDADSTMISYVDARPLVLPPFTGRVELLQASETGAAFVFSGEPIRGSFESQLTLDQLSTKTEVWAARLSAHFKSVVDKKYANRSRVVVVSDSVLARSLARDSSQRNNLDTPARVAFNLEVTNPELIASLLRTSGSADMLLLQGNGTISNDALQLSSSIKADSLRTDGLTATDLRSTITLNAELVPSLQRSLTLDAAIRSSSAMVGRQTLVSPVLSIRHREGTGTYRFQSGAGSRVGPIDVRAQLTTLGPSNRLIIDSARIVAGDYHIGVTSPNFIDLYADAIVARRFELSSGADDGARQRLVVDGAYSSLTSDTLRITSEHIELDQLSDFFAVRKQIGGTLNGTAAITKHDGRPVISGDFDVAGISLAHRILGDLNVNARFVPGTSTVTVDASVSPVDASRPTDLDKTVTRNALHASGTVDFADATTGPTLDLTADIRRADLFFFEYIFPHTIESVEGFVAGTGTIKGTWQDPLFEADLAIRDGSFTVPDFGLAFLIAGEVKVDAAGVHISEGRLRDGQNGTAVISGSVLFNDYRFFSLDLRGNLSELQIMNVETSNELPFFGHIWASGDAVLTGPISNATLRSANAQTTNQSVLSIPLVAVTSTSDAAFIVFADSSGVIPESSARRSRQNVLDSRPVSERTFLDGLEMDLNLFGPEGSTVNLIIDPLLGDVLNAVGSGRVQVIRNEGEFTTFGSFEVNSGGYLFTAGDVFVRRFTIDGGGSLTWDGDPTDAILNVPASYQTRASSAGLPGADGQVGTIPLIVRLQITGRVSTPEVTLSLEVDRTNRSFSGSYQALEAVLNQPARSTEYATSVLVTNSFLLTTSDVGSTALASSAFNSVSQLVASQINRYLNEALPNVDFSFGVQGESAQELGVTYGIALRLLDERLVIRGQGVYQGNRPDAVSSATSQPIEGEFVVELRLSPNVSVEAFYRREGDVLTETATTTGSTGAGVSYQTEFSSWRRFFKRVVGQNDPLPSSTAASSDNQ